MDLKIPSFGNDLITMFTNNWVYVGLIGAGIVILGIATCTITGV